MTFVLNSIIEHGSRAVRVFPPESGVLIAFAERIASEVVCVMIYPTFLFHQIYLAGWRVHHNPPHARTGSLFILKFSGNPGTISPSDGSVI